MRLGAHISIGKGLEEMARDAARLNLETAQVFTRSPRGGRPREIPDKEAEAARLLLHEANVRPLLVHTPYLVNLGSEEEAKNRYSVETTALDLQRADKLGASIVVVHVGRYDSTEQEGIRAVARSIDRILDEANASSRLCLENTAGQGRELGYELRHIGQVMGEARHGDKLGLCLDTCHAFAAGYDVSSEDGWTSLLGEIQSELGLGRLMAVHCNDCAGPLGCRRDRHRHIGEGSIGLEGFRIMLHRPEMKRLPCILETPVKAMSEYEADLNVLRTLRQGA